MRPFITSDIHWLIVKVVNFADALSSINDVCVLQTILYLSLLNCICSLQIVIVNRLILNLIRGADDRAGSDFEFQTRTGLEPPAFASGSFLGNIGGPVRTFPEDFDDDLIGGYENNYVSAELPTTNYAE